MSVEHAQPTPAEAGPARIRTLLRLLVALLASGALTLVAWWVLPTGEPRRLDVVGYPSFAAYNFRGMFLGYRLSVWLLPLLTAIAFVLLGRTRAFAGPSVRGRRPVPLVEPDAPPEASGRTSYLAILPAAAVLAVAVSSSSTDPDTHLTAAGVAAAAGYVAVVLLVAAVLRRRQGAGAEPVATVNTLAATLAAVGGFFWFTQHTVAVTDTGSVDSWPWLPFWYAVPVAVLVLAWLVRRRATGTAVRDLQRRVNHALVGSVAVFLVTASLPATIPTLQGFDDMLSVTGADLWLRGDFPWRDLLFVHGFFEDVLRSAAGFGLFEHTLWGADAASTALWVPLGWVGLYLLGVWAAPRSWLAALGSFTLVVLAAAAVPLPMRWVAAGLVFLLLGEAVRRRQRRWTALMTVALFVEAVLVPEASFQVLATAAVLVLVDLVHRTPDRSWWRSLRLTRDFVLTGLVCTAVWSVYLALNSALGAFIGYYLTFGPGHVATGAQPFLQLSSPGSVMAFLLAAALIAATLGHVWWRLLSRRPMSPQLWVVVATVLFAALYGEKGLGRADPSHLMQSVAMTLPLAFVWLALLLQSLELRLHRRTAAPARRLVLPAVVATACLLLVATAGWSAPRHNKVVVSGASTPLIGYSQADTVDRGMLDDLASVVHSLGGSKGSFFDFTNSPGFFHYLLGLDSPTAFYHVSMAVPQYSQDVVIDALEKKRPAVVAFDSSDIGFPIWDLVANDIRHYAISRYLLDGWTPVVRSHDVLFLLRNDLVPKLRSMGPLTERGRTVGLYSSGRRCDWGYTPGYLESKPRGPATNLSVTSPRWAHRWEVSGWAYDDAAGLPVDRIIVAAGAKVVQTLQADQWRKDLAVRFEEPPKERSSFTGWTITAETAKPTVYAVLSDGAAHPVGERRDDLPAELRDTDGTVRTSPVPAEGRLQTVTSQRARISKVLVPSRADQPSFPLATFRASGPTGRSDVLLAESLRGSAGHDTAITFQTRPWQRSSTSVRTGSCPQWHGYASGVLYLVQSGGRPITQIRLSDVR